MLPSGLASKLIRCKEIYRVIKKEKIISIKHEDILTGMTDIHLSLWILIFCLKYRKLKLRTPIFCAKQIRQGYQFRTHVDICVAE